MEKKLPTSVPYNATEQAEFDRITSRLNDMKTLRTLKLNLLGKKSVEQKIQTNIDSHIGAKVAVPPRHAWKSQIKGTQSQNKFFKLISLMLADNLGPKVTAFDKQYDEMSSLSRSLTNVVRQTNRIEDIYQTGDAQDALSELVKQGTVFVEEIYDTITETDKQFIFDPTDFEKMKDVKITTREEARVYKRVLNPSDVFLGSFRVGSIQEQPDVAIRRFADWGTAKKLYGNWERWPEVEKRQGKTLAELETTYNKYGDSFYTLEKQPDNKRVEIVKYMRSDNTYQIFINGVMMLPAGTGFPWKYNKFNIASQKLYGYAVDFPYGRSLYDLLGPDQEVSDRTLSLIVDRGRQMLEPSVAIMNKSVRAVNLFKPGTAHRGISKEDFQVLTPQGSMGSDPWNIVQHFDAEIDKMFSPTSMGAPLSGEHSATEVTEMQKNSIKILGYIQLAYELLIRDMTWLRIDNIIKNCISVDSKPAKAYNGLLETFLLPDFQEYLISDAMLYNGKKGKMRVRFIPKKDQERVLRTEVSITDGELDAAEKLGLTRMETLLLKKSAANGNAYEEILLDPDMMMNLQWYFMVVSEPMKKVTSALEKAQFSEAMTTALNTFGPEQVNLEYWKERFTAVFELSDDAFTEGSPQPQPMAAQTPGAPTAEGGDGRMMEQGGRGRPTMSNQANASITGLSKQ